MTATGVMGECERRLTKHYFELRRLYGELYNGDMRAFDYFCTMLRRTYGERSEELRRTDREREKKPEWYRDRNFTGMTLYAQNFAGTLKGVESKLDYIRECGVDFLHIQPFLASTKGRDDGGYAVSDYRKVNERLGTVGDLESLAKSCHEQGILLSADFVMNHTSEDHPWAVAAKNGDRYAQDRYFFFDDWTVPDKYDEFMPQVFPETAPGNFTWCEEAGKVVMTTFYAYQWDLNYRNPMVMNDMTENMLWLCNRGIDAIRMDTLTYLWKEPGTSCRDLPRVHKLCRILRMAVEVVCPGVLLIGEVGMAPDRAALYFGSAEHPECHIVCNVSAMANLWNSVATHDVRLMENRLKKVYSDYGSKLYIDYVRCHEDIHWQLDYRFLAEFGMQEGPHRKYLNDYFRGGYDSDARGELYNDDPHVDATRLCGTTASLSGIEGAEASGDPWRIARAICLDGMLHAYLFSRGCIPMIYSGDEIAQLNDYHYHEDIDRRDDSRYLHRGPMIWENAEKRYTPGTREEAMFSFLREIWQIRKDHPAFSDRAARYILPTWNLHILGLVMEYKEERIIALFNFSPEEEIAWIDEPGDYTDLVTGDVRAARGVSMKGFTFLWLSTTWAPEE